MRARVGRFAKPRRFRSERRAARAAADAPTRPGGPPSHGARRATSRAASSSVASASASRDSSASSVAPDAQRNALASAAAYSSAPASDPHPSDVRTMNSPCGSSTRARCIHVRSCASAGRDAASARRRRSGRAAGSKPPDDNADASRVKKTTPSGDGSDPFESARAKRDDSVASCARRRRVCARTSRSVTPPEEPEVEAFAPSSASAFGFDVVSFRAPDVSDSSRRFASRRAYADASGAPAARSAARRRATALGSARKAASCALRIARVAAAAACVARLADSRTRRLEDSPNPNPRNPGTLDRFRIPSCPSRTRRARRAAPPPSPKARASPPPRPRSRLEDEATDARDSRTRLFVSRTSPRVRPRARATPPRRVPPPSPSPGPRRRKRDARRGEDARRTRGRTRANRGS